MAITARDIITDALIEIGAIAQGDGIPANLSDWCVRKANRRLDLYNAKSPLIFNVNFVTYTITPSHQPHTIGVGGDYAVTVRPERIVAANLILTNVSPNVMIPLYIADDKWWADQSVQGLTSTIPTALYYSPDWPLGKIYLWPVPTQANSLQLETWNVFTEFATLDSVFTYPPGYRQLIVTELAIDLCPGFNREPSAVLVAMRAEALKAIEANNIASPRISLRDAGLPDKSPGSGSFNWLTGGIGNK